MPRAGLYAAAFVLALIPSARAAAADPKGVDLTALRDAVETAAKKGENVGEIREALAALEKAAPKAAIGRATPELQTLRDAVDAAAKKGENVELIAKELSKVEVAVAGRELIKPKPEPKPEPRPRPDVNPLELFPLIPPNAAGGAGIDVELFNKAMELRRKATELLLKDPNDKEVRKEALRLQAEAAELMMKAARGLAGGNGGIGAFPAPPLFPDMAGRIPERARLGIRLERVPALVTEQLGLGANTGIAVTQVAAGSAAEKAGLKVHDIILEFAGKAVTDDTDAFIRRVNGVKAGEKIDMVLLRKGKKVEVKGVELPAAANAGLVPIPNFANPLDPFVDPAKIAPKP